MTESIDNSRENSGFIGYVRSLPASELSDMLSSRIIPSFLKTVNRHDFTDFSEVVIRYWIVDMLALMFKPSTVQRYLGAVHKLYLKWKDSGMAGIPADSVDFTLPEEAKLSDLQIEDRKYAERNLQKISDFLKYNARSFTPKHLYLNIFQYLLINPTATLNDIIDLRFSDSLPDIVYIEDIRKSMRKTPQAQYVFPLEQGKRRNPAILRDVLSNLHKYAGASGLQFSNLFSRESISSIWIAAALREDISYSEITALFDKIPSPYSFLSLIPHRVILSEEHKSGILNKVAQSLINKTTAWFVMRLRAGVTPESVKLELKERKFNAFNQIQFYYPTYVAKRPRGKKMKSVEIPVLPGRLFFRTQYDRISRMMSLIGDLAWCYRTTASSYSPYSAISQKEMKTFQRSVGMLTSDIEMEIISSLPELEVGDEVVIDDGSPFTGMHATIRKVRKSNGMLSYSLRLTDTEYIHWTEMTLPAISVSKID